ncbi:enoyl-CoA hydratase/isomerase family protein [Sphingomonas sp. TDK1]|uniref:enoyl-CoA hydratase/isomerase family protein n=1 Tax=Sphingomonas sp. TDK1 TaxID=453247 RepID=UPI0007D99CFB|nr:enoyl-CoA hydratase/isomerase family protein [Sphingomonas sp. TDK1]OAN65848.1 enoyl-CoA hydratase [Sphingomonas sp. TDK1]
METVLLHREGPVARLTLNRPEVGNAIDPALAAALAKAARIVAADPTVRCVVLTGAGRLFCAGGDLAGIAAAGDGASRFLHDLADMLHDAVFTLATMAKPLLVVANGPAAGAGLSLVLLGDVALAARTAHFTAAYAGVGLTPDGGMSWLLPRLVGLRQAQAMLLTNRRVDAEAAERLGIVTQTVEDDALDAEAHRLAARLVRSPSGAIGAARGLLLEGAVSALRSHLDREAATIAAAAGTAEGQEGIAAFLDRRTPDFLPG